MGQIIRQHLSRAHGQMFQTKAPNTRQRGLDHFEEFLHRTEYRLSTGSTSMSSTQRCGTRRQDFQGTLCGRALLSGPLLPNALVGQTLATAGNHFKSPADLSSASTDLCRRALQWDRGLQQDILCSTKMKNHRPRETRQAANLGSSRAEWILTWSCHASLPLSKCIHFDNCQRPHRGYSRILSPQLSNATVITHRPFTNDSQRHDRRFPESASRRPIRQRRG
jgi:hypothetical protein